MDAEAIQLLAIDLADQALTAVEENSGGDEYAVPLILYLVAAKLHATANAGGRL